MGRLLFTFLVVGLVVLAIGSGLAIQALGLSPSVSGSIVDSQRFINVLKEEKVVAWFNGHVHSDHSMPGTRVDKWGTTFIDDGSIIDNPESLLLIFENGKREVRVRSRSHSEAEWNGLEDKFSFDLDSPFRWGKRTLRVWVWSDSQPVTETHWKRLEEAIEDVDKNMEPDISLVLGDLVDHGSKEEYERYLDYIDNSDLPRENFYELAGNHNFGPYYAGDLSNYQTYIENELRYARKVGNVLFVFMSDEEPGSAGDISDETFRWWKNVVKNNQDDMNVITLTHQPLRGTTRKSVPSVWDPMLDQPIILFFAVLAIVLSPIVSYEVS